MGAVKWYGDEVIKEIRKASRKALQESGKLIVREAKSLCPVGIEERFVAKSGQYAGKNYSGRIPGTLKRSIRYRVTRNGKSVQVIAGGRSGEYLTAFYSAMVEWGTHRMLARPFLRPALEKSMQQVQLIFNEWIGRSTK
jgi:HK97 gp10 family phage protein